MNLLGRGIADERLLGLIGRYLRAGALVGEHIEPSEVGTRAAFVYLGRGATRTAV